MISYLKIACGLMVLLSSQTAMSQRRIDLKEYRIQQAGLQWPPYSVAFLDDKTVGVAFVAENDSPGLSNREDPQNGRYQFTTALINFDDAKVISIHAWGNARHDHQFLALDSNRILLATSRLLAVYSRSYEKLLQRDVQDGRYPDVRLSPDHQSICRDVLEPNTEKLRITVFTASAVEPIRELPDSGVPTDCDGLNLLFWERHGSKQAELRTTRIFVQHDHQPKYELHLSISNPKGPCTGGMSLYRPSLLSHDRVLAQCGEELVIAELNGNVLRRLALGDRSISGQATESTDGSAIAVGTLRQGSWYDRFHISDYRLLIMDGKALTELRSIPIELPGNQKPVFSLSASGKRLAFLNDGKVTLVELGTDH